ncbi:hypothetical protein CMI37_20285 [Candidatus Pacearchaeota archaeon]|nr:hypothetical protein [Candidatus Pacearchaeota archaeon]|tara:strand:- start:276 stop:722 length:447 start_codon:yes stop_codon:yes gene_type:complete
MNLALSFRLWRYEADVEFSFDRTRVGKTTRTVAWDHRRLAPAGLSMSIGDQSKGKNQADLDMARQAATMAHAVVIRLTTLDEELGALSTDLGDLWSAQKVLSGQLEGMLNSTGGWGELGDSLVDLKTSIDHMAWHLKSVRRPLSKITH